MDFMFLTGLNSCVILNVIIEPLQLLKFLDIQATTKTRHDKNTQLKNFFVSQARIQHLKEVSQVDKICLFDEIRLFQILTCLTFHMYHYQS